MKTSATMRTSRFIVRYILAVTALIVVVWSCSRNDDPGYDYFVSKELSVTYTKATITAMMDIAVQSYPEISGLKPYVTGDVDVFKITYNTTVDAKEITASGLVCVPLTEGEYPVLSFQNGTNTVNANAPTEYVTNPSYQLVEFIASMGFVVVIPDYPGFGSSAAIPHPYLIKEPTVTSIVDMFRAVNECSETEFPGIKVSNEYYLIGYSQGGWATLALHKAIETDLAGEFDLYGSVCGAGPYDLYNLLTGMVSAATYPMPSYIAYIVNAYSYYRQFTNPVTEILNQPYADKLGSLFTGTLTTGQINSQLTTSIPGLLKQEFLDGFVSSASYSSVREALTSNSITAWNTGVPLLFVHGEGDTHVSVTATNTMYDAMITAGTSPVSCRKILFPGLDHGDGIVPAMTEGLLFLLDIMHR